MAIRYRRRTGFSSINWAPLPYVYTTLEGKYFTTDDRLSNGWTTISGNNNNVTCSGWVWHGNTTDGAQWLYKNFASGLSNFKITYKAAACSWNDAWWWSWGSFIIYDSAHTWANTFDPANLLVFNREMYASSAQSYNGIPTYHRWAFSRKVNWSYTTTWATREWEWATVYTAILTMEVEFNNWIFTYKVFSDGVLVWNYTFTANFTKAYSFAYSVSASTWAYVNVDEIVLQY